MPQPVPSIKVLLPALSSDGIVRITPIPNIVLHLRISKDHAMTRPQPRVSALFFSLAILALALTSCNSNSGLPSKSLPTYKEAVSTFYIGLSALQVGDDVQ